jgi:hypothetical protein
MVSPEAFFRPLNCNESGFIFRLLILLLSCIVEIATLYCYGIGSPVERQSLKWSLNSKCSVAKMSAEYRRSMM